MFSRLSTPAGLSEWFADDVFQKGNQFIFIWNGSEQPATLVELKSNAVVRFRWDDAEEEDECVNDTAQFHHDHGSHRRQLINS